jgi:hypothetical protein
LHRAWSYRQTLQWSLRSRSKEVEMKKFLLLLPLVLLYGCAGVHTYVESDIPFIADAAQQAQQRMLLNSPCGAKNVTITARSSATRVHGNMRERHELHKECK